MSLLSGKWQVNKGVDIVLPCVSTLCVHVRVCFHACQRNSESERSDWECRRGQIYECVMKHLWLRQTKQRPCQPHPQTHTNSHTFVLQACPVPASTGRQARFRSKKKKNTKITQKQKGRKMKIGEVKRILEM